MSMQALNVTPKAAMPSGTHGFQLDEKSFQDMYRLKLETRDAINRRNWDTLRKHFVFVSEVMDEAGAELRETIMVSYLGSLFYGEISLNYAKARSLLPRNLVTALRTIEEHYENLVS